MLNGPNGNRQRSLPSVLKAIRPKSWKNAETLVPSVTGDGDAGPLTFSMRPVCRRGTSWRHSSLPVARTSESTMSASPCTPVMKICGAVRAGDDSPAGTLAFQTTFLSGPNSAGNPVLVDMPVPFGPRKRVHSGSLAASERAISNHPYFVIIQPQYASAWDLPRHGISRLKAGAVY